MLTTDESSAIADSLLSRAGRTSACFQSHSRQCLEVLWSRLNSTRGAGLPRPSGLTVFKDYTGFEGNKSETSRQSRPLRTHQFATWPGPSTPKTQRTYHFVLAELLAFYVRKSSGLENWLRSASNVAARAFHRRCQSPTLLGTGEAPTRYTRGGCVSVRLLTLSAGEKRRAGIRYSRLLMLFGNMRSGKCRRSGPGHLHSLVSSLAPDSSEPNRRPLVDTATYLVPSASTHDRCSQPRCPVFDYLSPPDFRRYKTTPCCTVATSSLIANLPIRHPRDSRSPWIITFRAITNVVTATLNPIPPSWRGLKNSRFLTSARCSDLSGSSAELISSSHPNWSG
nr:hypothetical protein CFP56_34896 [Quercus suber]